MTRSHRLPRPVAILSMLALLLVLPVGFSAAIRIGSQPAVDLLARTFGGTAGTLLPRPLVNWMALVGCGCRIAHPQPPKRRPILYGLICECERAARNRCSR
jgi:hypothetical protein